MLRKILSWTLPHSLKQYLQGLVFKLSRKLHSPKVFCVKTKESKRLFLSNTVDITHWDRVDFGNNVFIWHFTILDSFNGIRIGNDCQIGTRVGIFTHSSHHSIRYYNSSYHDTYFDSHKGRVRGNVEIGDNTFVGANAIIMPNTKIGRGCIVSAFSYVQGYFDDFSIIAGNPAKKVGDVRKADYRFFKENPELLQSYLDYYGLSAAEDLKIDE